MARAKQTARAEARRRHRQATSQPAVEEEGSELDYGERRPNAPAVKTPGRSPDRAAPPPGGRMGFGDAFRNAYHRANVREDLRSLPTILRSRAFLAAAGLVLAGAVVTFLFPGYTGSAFALELLVWPGSALAPQLVAGFFAPRASYLLGLIVGLLQGVVFSIMLSQFATRLGTTLPPEEIPNLLSLSFITGPLSGALFAAAAAWYRRFLALSSPRRAQARSGGGRGGGNRGNTRSNTSRRSASR